MRLSVDAGAGASARSCARPVVSLREQVRCAVLRDKFPGLARLRPQGRVSPQPVGSSQALRRHAGHADRKRDISELECDERRQALRDYVAKGQARLMAACCPARSFSEVDAFVWRLEDESLLRRPILVFVGGTNLGKSLLAADVLQRVAKMLHVPGFLEVAVENDSFLDLTGFDIRLHAGVLLDGVGDAEVLKQNREVLQGRPKLCKAGRSPTRRLSTAYSLYRQAVVATFDLAAKNLRQLQSDHWLSKDKNIIRLRLSAPA